MIPMQTCQPSKPSTPMQARKACEEIGSTLRLERLQQQAADAVVSSRSTQGGGEGDKAGGQAPMQINFILKVGHLPRLCGPARTCARLRCCNEPHITRCVCVVVVCVCVPVCLCAGLVPCVAKPIQQAQNKQNLPGLSTQPGRTGGCQRYTGSHQGSCGEPAPGAGVSTLPARGCRPSHPGGCGPGSFHPGHHSGLQHPHAGQPACSGQT